MRPSEVLMDLGRPLAFYPRLALITGGCTQTVLLCQLLYWTGKQTDPDGWIYKTQAEIQEETSLSRREQETTRHSLRESGLLEEEKRGMPAKLFFRVRLDVLDARWETVVRHACMRESAIQECAKAPSKNARKRHPAPSNTETTTETTTEKGGVVRGRERPPQNLSAENTRFLLSQNGFSLETGALVAYYVDTCKELNREPLISKKGMVAKKIGVLLHDGAATVEEIRRGLRRSVQKSNPGILENLIAEARPLPPGALVEEEEKDPWEEWDRNRRIGMEAGAGRRATQEDRDYFRAIAEKNGDSRR